MRKMLSDGLYACGTVRGNRSCLSEILTNKMLKLERGEFSFETKSGVGAVRWKDDKDAVSYTHLDVYKRQLGCLLKIRNIFNFLMN